MIAISSETKRVSINFYRKAACVQTFSTILHISPTKNKTTDITWALLAGINHYVRHIRAHEIFQLNCNAKPFINPFKPIWERIYF